jgi:hypothetical protein
MKSRAAIWLVLVLLLLATIAIVAFTTVVVSVIAVTLLVVAFVGVVRRSSWGISAASALSWFILILAFVSVLGDPEPPQVKSVAEIVLRHTPSLTESYIATALAVLPWLLCLHILGIHRKRSKVSAP